MDMWKEGEREDDTHTERTIYTIKPLTSTPVKLCDFVVLKLQVSWIISQYVIAFSHVSGGSNDGNVTNATLPQLELSSTRLDYCHSLYLGVGQSSLSHLQLVQNVAAKLLTGTRKRDDITLALLHPCTGYLLNFNFMISSFRLLFLKPHMGWHPCTFQNFPTLTLGLLDHQKIVLTIPRSRLEG